MSFTSRKRFPVDDIRPIAGRLSGAITCNSLTRKPLALEHDIVVELAPFRLGRLVQDTAVELSSVPLAVRSWRALAGRRYALAPDAPDLPPRTVDGERLSRADEPHGSIQLLHHHLAVRATRLAFGPIAGSAIAAQLAVTLELTAIRYPPTELVLSSALRLGPVRVFGDIAMLARPSPDEARELAAHFIDLDDYELRVVDGVVSCVPTV